jgi:hypothetical protein
VKNTTSKNGLAATHVTLSLAACLGALSDFIFNSYWCNAPLPHQPVSFYRVSIPLSTIFKQHVTRTGYSITNYVWPEEQKFMDEVNNFYKTWAGCYPSVTFSFPSHHKIFGDSAVCCLITVTDCTLPRCRMNLIYLPCSPEGEITDLQLVWQTRNCYKNRPQPWTGGQTVCKWCFHRR